jgi:hypothetical protein
MPSLSLNCCGMPGELRSSNEEDNLPFVRMLEGDYEEALRLFIERARDGKPLVGFTGLRVNYFALKRLPEFATLDKLIQDYRKEQRAIYDELTAARASSQDAAHP